MLLCVVCLLGAVLSRPTFRELIPNGLRVACPEGQEDNCVNNICEGVGHLTCLGSGHRNPFGLDFQLAGFRWSKELCETDSDGDGVPNGVELGDPCCLWKQGWKSTTSYEVSHPGFANSIPNQVTEMPDCDKLSSQEAEEEEDIPSSISYFESEGDDLHVFEYRMNRHVVPTTLNSYFDVHFNFPTDKTYDIIGMEPIVDNAQVLHHLVAMACNQETNDEGEPISRESDIMTPGCGEFFYTWVVGGELHVLHESVGFRVGKGTARPSFNLNFHYNNALQEGNQTDASGVRLFMTTKLREQEFGGFFTGGGINVGEIPAGKESYYSSTFCRVNVDTEIAPNGVEVFSFVPHAHYLGRAIFIEKIKKIEDLNVTDKVITQNGEYAKIGSVGEEWNFDYNYQKDNIFQVPQKFFDGDLLVTTCVYDSSSRNYSTYGGLRTENEMCTVFFMIAPRQALSQQINCNVGERYNGEFPQNTTSILQLPLKQQFNYEQAREDGLLVCPKEFNMSVEDLPRMCPRLGHLTVETPFWSSQYQCSTECAVFLYQLLECNVLHDMIQSGGLSNIPEGSILFSFYGGEAIEEFIQIALEDPSILIPQKCTEKFEEYYIQSQNTR